jgi:glutamate/tyrosine decarboxylase-like PLP-dependent enzyme
MRPQDVRLPPELARRLAQRVAELLPLGSLSADRRETSEPERAALAELAERLENTYPYPDAHYAGQMLKPPHALAWAAYATTMLLNPNNHALDGGPATAGMEREAVAELAGMFGLDPHLGHLTSSGTIANL